MLTSGFSGAGIEGVLKSVGVPKGSFYYYFKSKEAFGLEVLKHYEAKIFGQFDQHYFNQQLSPLNRLRSAMALGMRVMVERQFKGGCLIGTLAQEMAAQSPAFREAIEGIYRRWRGSHLQCFAAAQRQGEISAELPLVYLTESYGMMLQGAIMEAKVTESLVPLQIVHWMYYEHLGRPDGRLDEETEALLRGNLCSLPAAMGAQLVTQGLTPPPAQPLGVVS